MPSPVRSLVLLALGVLAAAPACTRKARDPAPRHDPGLRPGARPDAGAPPRDAGSPRPAPRDAGTVGAMNPARTEEITPERVIAKGWYRCLVYERYVVLQSGPTDSPHDFAVKARGPDLDAACRWKGPFLFARQTGEPSHLRYFFVGMFRDSVLYKVFHDGAEFILHDLPARKERLRYIYGHADDEPRYEGNGRFTWWTPVSHVASGGASEKACNQHLRDALVKLKAEHRPLYDGLAPEPCWRPMNLDYSEPGSPSCDRFAWWGRFELDLRNPRPRRLPELRCGWMSAL